MLWHIADRLSKRRLQRARGVHVQRWRPPTIGWSTIPGARPCLILYRFKLASPARPAAPAPAPAAPTGPTSSCHSCCARSRLIASSVQLVCAFPAQLLFLRQWLCGLMVPGLTLFSASRLHTRHCSDLPALGAEVCRRRGAFQPLFAAAAAARRPAPPTAAAQAGGAGAAVAARQRGRGRRGRAWQPAFEQVHGRQVALEAGRLLLEGLGLPRQHLLVRCGVARDPAQQGAEREGWA
jgi:hypothetical protein